MSPSPYIPATVPGLVVDWCGIAEVQAGPDDWRRGILTLTPWQGHAVIHTGGEDWVRSYDTIRLDARRPEVLHRCADWAQAKGHDLLALVPVALGGRLDLGDAARNLNVGAVLVAESVRRIAEGRPLLAGLLVVEPEGVYRQTKRGHVVRYWSEGPALAAGYALLDGDVVRVGGGE